MWCNLNIWKKLFQVVKKKIKIKLEWIHSRTHSQDYNVEIFMHLIATSWNIKQNKNVQKSLVNMIWHTEKKSKFQKKEINSELNIMIRRFNGHFTNLWVWTNWTVWLGKIDISAKETLNFSIFCQVRDVGP